MRKLLISLIIGLTAVIALNFSAFFMHKRSLETAIESIKSKINESGLNVELQDIMFKNYKGWNPIFTIPNIVIKDGNKYNRSIYTITNLYVEFATFERKIKISTNNEIRIDKKSVDKDKALILEFTNGITIDANFDSSVDLFLRNLDQSPLSKLKNINFENEGLKVYESIKEQKLLAITSERAFFMINKIKMSNPNLNDNYSFNIRTGIKDVSYDNGHLINQYDQILIKLGKSSMHLDAVYSHYIDENGVTHTNIVANDINSNNDAVEIKVSGTTHFDSSKPSPDVNLQIFARNYKMIVQYYFDMLNNSMRSLNIKTSSFIKQSQIDNAIDIIANLPEILQDGGIDAKFHVTKSIDTEFIIGGELASIISQKLSKIFPNYLKIGQ